MIVGVVREVEGDERRVALVPETVKRLTARKIDVVMQRGAGDGAFFADADYADAGATVVTEPADVYAVADALARVSEPRDADIARIADGRTLLALLHPLTNVAVVRKLNEKKLTAIALDMLPRITMAQSMDVLSSQANIAGYWAVLAAASRLPRYFPMLMTAAGTITPARVLVMGVGVAGLQAVGTARRLGAVVEAIDVRPETKEQVESLGARFLEVTGIDSTPGEGGYAAAQSEEYRRRQGELVAAAVQRADVVITTALVPGRRAPVLVTRAQVASMRAGGVVVDLAASAGGNVEGCTPGTETVTKNGVLILNPMNAPSAVPTHASATFSRNLEKLLLHLTTDGALDLRDDDEVQRGCVITRDGDVVHPRVREVVRAGSR